MRNLLMEFGRNSDATRPCTMVGFREHIFTAGLTSLATFMGLQEGCFVTLSQRTLATPLRMRLHYGHPGERRGGSGGGAGREQGASAGARSAAPARLSRAACAARRSVALRSPPFSPSASARLRCAPPLSHRPPPLGCVALPPFLTVRLASAPRAACATSVTHP
jgi:hypothetical protein